MRVTFKNNRFYCVCDFDNRAIPKNAGFTWDIDGKVWSTADVGVASNLRKYADDSAKSKFNSVLITHKPWTGAIPTPADRKLYPFQEQAARWALSRNKSYLGLDPGLGKTPISVACVNSEPGKVLFITPPFLKYNVEIEFKNWSTRTLNIVIIESQKYKPDVWKNADVLILPDSIAHRAYILDQLETYTFQWCFLDEAHRFKNRDTKRTLAVFGGSSSERRYLGLIKRAHRVVALSGTPMPNRPAELFPVLNALAPETINHMNFNAYAERYCAAFRSQWGWDTSGASNHEELGQAVKKNFLLRMKKKDVLKELPEKTEQVIFLDHKASSRILDLENKIFASKTIAQVIKEVGSGPMDISYRKELGEEKAPHAAQFIKDLLENDSDEKMILFAWHRSVIEILEDLLKDFNPFVITGATSMERRQKSVEAFQAPGCPTRLFIGNIDAMGVGLTLTAATRVVFAEYSWVPAQNEQAADRAHRIGQKDNVLVQFLALRDCMDVRIISTLLAKQKVITKVTG